MATQQSAGLPGERPDLTVQLRRSGTVTQLRLSGELDVANAEVVRRIATRLVDEGQVDVEINAADLEFVDAAGLGALVHLQQQVTRAGGQLRMTGVRPFQRRVISLAHLEQTLGVR